ncbi:MAG: serine/threonine-protein kinase [Planctomycetota bacterium]
MTSSPDEPQPKSTKGDLTSAGGKNLTRIDSSSQLSQRPNNAPEHVDKSPSPHAPTLSDSSGEGGSTAQRELPATFGRYQIIKRLGRGGMGAVFLAQDPQLDRLVAIKVPHLSVAENEGGLARFWREARTAAKLHHANICPVHEIGEAEGKQYLVMAYIEGTPLSKFVDQNGKLSQRDAALLVRKVALAMQEAHRLNIVHRDLKPANIMIDRHKEPIVMDFGLAWQATDDDVRITRQGTVVGTPAYMPPEQIHRKWGPLGPATDVYSLGIVLYELLTGRLPFEGDFASVVAQVVARKPTKPSVHRPDLDPKLENACLKAMSKKVEDRYPDMGAFAADLADFLKNPTSASVIAARVAKAEAKASGVEVIEEPDTTPKRKKSATARLAEPDEYEVYIEPAPRPPRPVRPRGSRPKQDDSVRYVMFLLLATCASIAVVIVAIALFRKIDQLTFSDGSSDSPPPAVAQANPTQPESAASKRAAPKNAAPLATEGPNGSPIPLSAAANSANRIPLSVSQAKIPAGVDPSLTIEFPALKALNGHWSIATVEIYVNGELIHEQSFSDVEAWGDSFNENRETDVTPSFTLAGTAMTRVLSKLRAQATVEINVEIVYPKLVNQNQFANEYKPLSRQLTLQAP